MGAVSAEERASGADVRAEVWVASVVADWGEASPEVDWAAGLPGAGSPEETSPAEVSREVSSLAVRSRAPLSREALTASAEGPDRQQG